MIGVLCSLIVVTSGELTLSSVSIRRSGVHRMSAPSRRPEIRRRRTRKEKIVKLRKLHAAASSETERARLSAKLHRQNLVSPGTPLLKTE
jgi:hypothetical protein